MGSRMVLYLLKLVLSRILPFLEKKSRGASPSNPRIISLPMPHTTSEVIIHGSKLRTCHCVRRHAPGEPPGRQILRPLHPGTAQRHPAPGAYAQHPGQAEGLCGQSAQRGAVKKSPERFYTFRGFFRYSITIVVVSPVCSFRYVTSESSGSIGAFSIGAL